MSRRKFDMVTSSIGVMLTVVLVVGGALAFWGYSFANNNVHKELTAQNIFFPPAGPAIADPAIAPYLTKYAGQQLVNGAQAEAYADHFIAVHLKSVHDGKTYAEVSALSRATPDDATLAAEVQDLFRGESLRGLLLNAFAFWKLGQIAKIAAFSLWILAGVMFLLSILGFWHLRRVPETERILAPAIEETRTPVLV